MKARPKRLFRSITRSLKKLLALHSPLKQLRLAKYAKLKTLKLNVGSGKAKLDGWVNIDMEPGADLVVDLRRGLPFPDSSADFIYCEHVLEHFTYEQGRKVLKEFYRCLKKGGAVRIAMPDLEYIVEKYVGDWENQDWLSWPEAASIKTRGQMINTSFRAWGHKYLYDEEDLRNQLQGAGFANLIRCEWSKSAQAELRDLETRKDTKLIMEAWKA